MDGHILSSLLSGGNLQDGRVLFQDAERDSFHVLTQLSVALLLHVESVHYLITQMCI